ncbi:MAG: hypothetical protein AAF266_10120 [Planctomycetota bacterium]
MKSLSLLATALAVVWVAGCGPSQTGPQLDPSQFPKALASLEAKTEQILAAFESGDPKAADRPLHQLGKLFASIKRLAEPAGLNADQLKGMNAAVDKINDAFAELHEPMHQAEFPEDFEFAPIRAKIEEGLKALRAALPTGIVAKLTEAAEERAAKMAERAAESDEDTEEASDDAADSEDYPPPFDDVETAPAAEPAPDTGAAAPAATSSIALTAARIGSGPPGVRNAPLGPSVMMFDAKTLELAPETISRVGLLQANAPPGSRWVQLVPTLHAKLRPDNTIESYGLMGDRNASWTDEDNFTPATDDLADRFRDAFAATIGQAVRLGVNVSILPHLDPAGGPHVEWRNFYRFRPGETIGVGSYESLLIEPLTQAILSEVTSGTRVDLALSGEMGRSLFEHPEEYLRLMKTLRLRFASAPNTGNVRVGIALNWSGLAADLEVSELDHSAIAALVMSSDFVGFSCYAPVSVPPTADDFAAAAASFKQQHFELTGVPVPIKRLVLSEAGIGGGTATRTADSLRLPTIEEVAEKPYEGRGNTQRDPWKAPAIALLRRQYHTALCDYLTATDDITPPVDKAFLWSEGPWDPQGIATECFRDDTIAEMIANHNAG